MRAIINRLRRLESAAAPVERERAAVEAILEARRRRLGADYKPITIPPEVFDGCRGLGERIIRARRLYMECESLIRPKSESSRTQE
jgi:hypothetical protein